MSSPSRSPAPAPGPAPAAPSALEDHLGYWLRAVSNHVSQSFTARLGAVGVTVAEWVVLRALFDADGLQPSELAERLGLSRGAVSKLVQRLAGKGLVTVHADPRDGRAQRLRLGPPGRALVPALAALADRNEDEAFGHLDPGERAALHAALRALAEHHGLRGAPVD